MSLKLQINNLEALERLLGGDTQIEFDIRQNIVEAFVKKHMKALVTTDLMAKTTEAVRKEIEDEFLVKTGNWSGSYMLSSKARELMKTEIAMAKTTLVREIVNEEFEKIGLSALIAERASYVANTLVDRVLDQRFNDSVDLEIRKRLNLKP